MQGQYRAGHPVSGIGQSHGGAGAESLADGITHHGS